MNRFLKAFGANLGTAMSRVGRSRTREVLLRQSDRTLEDAGFCRELLSQGVQAWPWRRDDAFEDARDVALFRQSQSRAIAELQAMNDRELADLSVARADIPRAVREGRVGIDVPVEIADRDERDDRLAA